jgi:hypothetical protein
VLNCAVALALTIAGGALQLMGLFLVFAELSAIRAHEWGIVPPWTRFWRWLHLRAQRAAGRVRSSWLGRKLGLYSASAHITPYASSATLSFGSGTLTLKKRPAQLPDDASDADRIVWLERYVRDQDEDLARFADRVAQEREIAVQQARQEDAAFRQEIEAQQEERRRQLQWSVRRQAVGTACVVVGLIMTTVGAAISL